MKIFFILIAFVLSINFSTSQNWVWAKDLTSGSGGSADGTSSCLDANGNVFLTGMYTGQLFIGSYIFTCSNSYDCFLVKYDNNGNILWAASSVGGIITSNGVTSDATGNVYLTGVFYCPTAVFGTYTLTNTGTSSAFLVKYDANGNVLWAKNSLGDGGDESVAVCTDALNNIYITGDYSSTLTAFGTSTLSGPSPTITSIFTVKYDPSGNVLWAKKSISNASDWGRGISALPNNDIVITGAFSGTTITFATQNATLSGAENIFITKYDSNGNVLWLKSTLGTNYEETNSIASDAYGNFYVTGFFITSFVANTTTLTGNGGMNFFIAKYNSTGTLTWAKTAQSNNDTRGWSISTYSSGVWATGSTSTAPVVFGSTTITPTTVGPDPAFIVNYDINGNVLYATALDSGGDDQLPISVDNSCNAYLGGDYACSTFVLGTNTLIASGAESAFVAKLSFSCQTSPDGILPASGSMGALKIFPNPNNGSFKIKGDIEKGEITLVNSLGETVHSQNILGNETLVDLKNIPKGFYQCFIARDNIIISKEKIIVK